MANFDPSLFRIETVKSTNKNSAQMIQIENDDGQKIKVYAQLLFIPKMSKFNEKVDRFLSIMLNVGDARQ